MRERGTGHEDWPTSETLGLWEMTEAQKFLVDRGVISVDPDGTVRLTREAWQAATIGTRYEERGALHFVRFKDEGRYE